VLLIKLLLRQRLRGGRKIDRSARAQGYLRAARPELCPGDRDALFDVFAPANMQAPLPAVVNLYVK